MSKNKPKHTPGPWSTESTVHEEAPVNWFDIWSPASESDSSISPIGHIEGVANAHLIAAAPDMYREISETVTAIRECFKHLDSDDTDSIGVILTETLSDLKEVISKVKGEN